jgi:crossover junction endodeoxyribonuclease RusA
MFYSFRFPPSANTCFRALGRGRVVLSKKYREYISDVQRLVGPVEPILGRLELIILLHAPTRRKYDIDNRIKPLLDAMERAGVFADDEQIDKITVERGEVWPRIGGALVWLDSRPDI